MTRRKARGRGLFVVVVLLVCAAALWWVEAKPSPPAPYSPSSTAPNGGKALDLLLAQLGDRESTTGPLPAPGQNGGAASLRPVG